MVKKIVLTTGDQDVVLEGIQAESLLQNVVERAAQKLFILYLSKDSRLKVSYPDPDSNSHSNDEWVPQEEAMRILDIKGKSKMAELRRGSPENGIIFSKYEKKIQYNRSSLIDYLWSHSTGRL